MPLDFRSDTVTRPTPGMRAAMAAAEVGDDVFGEDPSVQRLEARVAGLLGKEAAVFVPSGTMSNLLGVLVHCGAGDELLCEAGCHIYNYEQSGYAQIGGIAARPVEGRFGALTVEQLEPLVRPENDHQVRTRLVCLENTHNRGGGSIYPYDTLAQVCRWAQERGLRAHLDGARLWNAAVATGIPLARWAEHFDTVSVCFSKGLGAPVGSALAGPSELIRRARRQRKVLGGGMRQAGVLAAAALYAVEHHQARLADDHANARRLAVHLKSCRGLTPRPAEPDTNIVIFAVDPQHGSAPRFAERLAEQGLLMLAVGPQSIRAVTHLDVSADDVEQAGEVLRQVAGRTAAEPLAAAS
jgi:threonine aldolase